MIRSSKVTLKFSNIGKLENLNIFMDEYKKIMVGFIDSIWNIEKIPSLLPKELTSNVSTWLSARAVQCAGKQASAVVRGTKLKQSRRLFVINKLKKDGKFKKARILEAIYNKNKESKPEVTNIECELDERFVKINLTKENSFDGWVTFSSLGNKLKFEIPFKKHKHFNSLLEKGNIKKGIRLGKDKITFNFDLKDSIPKTEGKLLGIDIGQKTVLSLSNGESLDKCPHGHNYSSICKKLARKKKGSKNFEQTVKHRKNYLRYIVNKLNLNGIKTVNRENIRNLRKFKRVSRSLGHWNYGELFEILDNKCLEQGVLVNKLSPTYTSQRCSSCGWVCKSNRNGKRFRCGKCSWEQDSDLNAARNLSLELAPIGKQERLQHNNRIGFYWNIVDEKFIVSHAQKTSLS